MAYWCVIQTESQREGIARQFLMRQYETYLPRVRRQGKILPLFPSYVFVRIIERWYPARWSPYVTRILMDGETPAKLSNDIVDAIKSREVGGVIVLPRGSRLKVGQKVSVVRRNSSFQGLIGIYAGMRGADCEMILLNLLGQEARVVLHTRDIAPA